MAYYINNLNQKIAYKYIKGKSPGIVFIHGLNSDMEGIKAKKIEKYAKKNGLAFIRFDCRGHGKSHVKFEDFTISDWKKDLIDLIDNVIKGKLILIGSSMGGWLMLLALTMRKKRIVGLLGISAATDFGKNIYNDLTKKSKKELKEKGITKIGEKNFSYKIKNKFFIEAKKNNILNKKIKSEKPIIFLHGLKDKVVDKIMPLKIMKIIIGKNVQIHYLNSSDHRFSSKSDIISIFNSINVIRSLNKIKHF